MALTRQPPARMRAVLLTGHGGFEQLAYRDDVPVPEVRAGDVRVRIRAAALNNTDINLRTGWYSSSVSSATDGAAAHADARAEDAGWDGAAIGFPRIQGADGCGEIVAVGAGVSGDRLGTRVLLNPILDQHYLGTDRDGCFAEYVALPSANAVAVHCSLSDIELASFPCSYLAAENMLARAAVGSGDSVLVTGASGGVGSAAIQLARRRGARVVALAAPDKASALLALGADKVIARTADLVAALGPSSIDAVIDCVGGAQFASLLTVLRRRGRYAVAGAIAGPIVQLDLRMLYLKDLSLSGCTMPAPHVFADLVGYIERGDIKPLIAATYPLQDIVVAQQAFLAKQHVGKIVLGV